jgi:hypothetical protein
MHALYLTQVFILRLLRPFVKTSIFTSTRLEARTCSLTAQFSTFLISHNGPKGVRFEVLTVASMKMAVFWVVVPCGLVEAYRHFRGDCPDDGGRKHL